MFKPYSTLQKALLEALVIAAGATALAAGVQWFHPNAIPFIATEAYETMVPCPVQEGEVTPLPPESPLLNDSNTLVIDAREEDAFNTWHVKNAMRVTYDFLDPIPPKEVTKIAQKIAAQGVARVIVYGDGDNPDTGKLLGFDISAAGINNVFFIMGGAPELQPQDGQKGVTQ